MTYAYVLDDRGMRNIIRGGYSTREAAEEVGRQEAADLCAQGLDTRFVCVFEQLS